MCLNRQVDSIRITLQRRNLHRIENGLVRFSVNRVKVPINSLSSFSLACEFLATVLRIKSRTFARHSCRCLRSIVRIFVSHELVAKVLNMFKKFMRIFSTKYFERLSHNCRATVIRLSCECRESVAAKFRRTLQCEIFATFVRMSYDSRATVLRKHANTSRLSGEKIKLSDIRTNGDSRRNVSRLSYEGK